jgi:hypothetical protein
MNKHMRTKQTKSQSSPSIAQLKREAARLRSEAALLEQQVINRQTPAHCQKAAKVIARRTGNVAVFLGAGASKTFGWPLTNQLLPIILDGLIKDDLFEDVRINRPADNAADRALLAKALTALCPGMELTKSYLEKNKDRLPLVTSLLSMLDYSLSSGQSLVSGLSADETKSARVFLERAIFESIEHQETATSRNNWPPREPNELATQLVQWLDQLRPKTTSVGVLTSNYDLAIEKAWGFSRHLMSATDDAIDFGFDWIWPSNLYPEEIISRSDSPTRRLYKLHGSTNWLRCGLCDRVYINPDVGIAAYAYKRKSTPNSSCHCGHGKLEVQIVSPSFVRDMKAPNLISVWQQALNWLRKADDWIIVGYSFPDEDLNIRSLFTRAFASGDDWPHVTAVQFGANDQTRMRYEAFFPLEKLTFLDGGLEMFLGNLKHNS